jgi:hypothetical protein
LSVLAIFRDRDAGGGATGSTPGSRWLAHSAFAEYLDHGRRCTARTTQVRRSFEDASLEQRALELVSAA